MLQILWYNLIQQYTENIFMQVFLILILCLVSLSSQSETTVISGDFLNDLRRTPVVGGGFSLTTEDYKSVCFEKIEVSKPSYDLYYDFQSIEKNWREQFYHQPQPDSSTRLTYWFLDQSLETGDSLRILARIQLKSYYAALNESQSQLSKSAQALLEKQDITGFFDACGTYYIKTISRYSTLYALFTLVDTTTTVQDFQYQLERLFQSIQNSSKTDNYFKNKTLYIRLAGFGLGKQQMVSLAPTDLDSFKEILQNSTKAMAGIHTGRVEALEIIPWMDNLNFQFSLLPLIENETAQNRFSRKWILAENSEFIALLKNHYRELQEQYFMALNCQLKFNRQISRQKDWKQIKFRNHRAPQTITGEELSEKLKPQPLYDKWQKFTQRADECLADIESEISTRSYRKISYCSSLIKELVQIMPQTLLDYCPPEVSNW